MNFSKKKDISFINDSKATSFKAAQYALSNEKNIYWILGGLPKKGDKLKLGNLKKNIIKCYLVGKHIKFFKNQIKGKINFSITKSLNNTLKQIFKDIKMQKKKSKTILLSPAAASFDQFDNFEKRGDEFKIYVENMLENTFKYRLSNYWKCIDKKILFSFLILFLLGLFFSFSSTSFLAGERLNKDFYFFFTKHLLFTFLAILVMVTISVIKTEIFVKLVIPLFIISFLFLAFVPIIGVEVKGAKRWIDFYFFRLQPIEILKPFFILMTVKILTYEKFKNSQIKYF